jgi:hypothetical protein
MSAIKADCEGRIERCYTRHPANTNGGGDWMAKTHTLRAGDICAFATSPVTPFSAPSTGRYAALKVLTSNKTIVYIVLDGVFDQRPDLLQAAALPPLRRGRFSSKCDPALLSTSSDWDIDLLDFTVIGNVEIAPTELAIVPRFPPFGTWSAANSDAEGEWRWRHDREAYKREIALDATARDAKRKAERVRYELRLKGLTWDTLLAETMFARWSRSPPFPPSDFVDAVRARFRDAILEMNGMAPKPTKQEVRRVLRALVDQINALDKAYGQVVETEEREDLCEALAELAYVARHPALMEEVNAWRSW